MSTLYKYYLRSSWKFIWLCATMMFLPALMAVLGSDEIPLDGPAIIWMMLGAVFCLTLFDCQEMELSLPFRRITIFWARLGILLTYTLGGLCFLTLEYIIASGGRLEDPARLLRLCLSGCLVSSSALVLMRLNAWATERLSFMGRIGLALFLVVPLGAIILLPFSGEIFGWSSVTVNVIYLILTTAGTGIAWRWYQDFSLEPVKPSFHSSLNVQRQPISATAILPRVARALTGFLPPRIRVPLVETYANVQTLLWCFLSLLFLPMATSSRVFLLYVCMGALMLFSALASGSRLVGFTPVRRRTVLRISMTFSSVFVIALFSLYVWVSGLSSPTSTDIEEGKTRIPGSHQAKDSSDESISVLNMDILFNYFINGDGADKISSHVPTWHHRATGKPIILSDESGHSRPPRITRSKNFLDLHYETYDPYTFDTQDPPGFVASQLTRYVRDNYGVNIAKESIDKAHATVMSRGDVKDTAAQTIILVQREHRDVLKKALLRLKVGWIMAALCVVFTLLIATYRAQTRPVPHAKSPLRDRGTFLLRATITVSVAVLFVSGHLAPLTRPLMYRFNGVVVQYFGWCVALFAVFSVLTYLIIERLFERCEAADKNRGKL